MRVNHPAASTNRLCRRRLLFTLGGATVVPAYMLPAARAQHARAWPERPVTFAS